MFLLPYGVFIDRFLKNLINDAQIPLDSSFFIYPKFYIFCNYFLPLENGLL